MKPAILFGLGIIILTSCSTQDKAQKENLKEFYFPYKTMFTPQKYIYVNANDTSDKSTWILQTKIQDNDTLFCTLIMDSQDRITEELIERIDLDASLMIKYTLHSYNKDSQESTYKCKILNPFVFKWISTNKDNYNWEVEYTDNSTSKNIRFSKSRSLFKVDKTNNTIEYNDYSQFYLIGTNEYYKYKMNSYYKKGKGLINYKLLLSNGIIKDYQLIN